MQGPPCLAHLRFWTTRGERKSAKREEEGELIPVISERRGSQVLHVWDRGFAGAFPDQHFVIEDLVAEGIESSPEPASMVRSRKTHPA